MNFTPNHVDFFETHRKLFSNKVVKSLGLYYESGHYFIFIIFVFQAYIKVNTLLNDFLTSRGVTQITVQPEFPRIVAIKTEEGGLNSFEKTKEGSSQSEWCVLIGSSLVWEVQEVR